MEAVGSWALSRNLDFRLLPRCDEICAVLRYYDASCGTKRRVVISQKSVKLVFKNVNHWSLNETHERNTNLSTLFHLRWKLISGHLNISPSQSKLHTQNLFYKN